jgi:hypothetical protein
MLAAFKFVLGLAAMNLISTSLLQAQAHFDHHPSTIQQHGNHFHQVPAHIDLHHNGHVHHGVTVVSPPSTPIIHGSHVHSTPTIIHQNPQYIPSGTIINSTVVSNSTSVPVNTVPFQGSGLKIINPATNVGPIDFVIDSQNYKLQAGQQIELKAKPTYVLKFDRGNGQGQKSYTIKDGDLYNFNVSNSSWDLTLQAPPTTSIVATTSTTVPSVISSAKPVLPTIDGSSVGKQAKILIDNAPLMNGTEQLGTIDRGQALKILAEKGNWLQVQTTWLNKNGWIKKELVEVTADVAPPADDVAPPAN